MLELYLLTFNCARNLVDPNTLAPVLFNALPPSTSVPDLVAISLQEISPIAYSFLGGSYLKPYFDRIQTTVQLAASLRSHDTEQLEHVASKSLGMTALMIFAKPHLRTRIQWIQPAGVGVGLWNMGNKGAVAMRLGISSPNSDSVLVMAIVAAHLAPMEANVQARNKDWESIVRNLVFLNDDDSGYSSSEEAPLLSSTSETPANGEGLFASTNHFIFLAGDLNYRTRDKPPSRVGHQTYPRLTLTDPDFEHFSDLFQEDQLIRELEGNRTLHHLQERPVRFPPTYKYTKRQKTSPGTVSSDEDWEWAAHRFPSWCDRILYLPPPNGAVSFGNYTALPVQHTSDHRPVALSLSIDEACFERDMQNHVPPSPPFPLNPGWKARRDAARQLEVLTGILSYLALTKEGNTILAGIGGIALATWWLSTWLRA
ncbi:DNase I-like protein [Westerdykella ornata]|uniref:DNase I-like protein n=1 Tax=Westerdykella ornata TaxID=318751 RepID=A0A6A6JUS6_WESOR|nr:DNase I-like protein [Westerdykella ornata]KAF2279568.1 DNase I-like protein [Westerdykella ornata]